jgi:hypothetical protein
MFAVYPADTCTAMWLHKPEVSDLIAIFQQNFKRTHFCADLRVILFLKTPT